MKFTINNCTVHIRRARRSKRERVRRKGRKATTTTATTTPPPTTTTPTTPTPTPTPPPTTTPPPTPPPPPAAAATATATATAITATATATATTAAATTTATATTTPPPPTTTTPTQPIFLEKLHTHKQILLFSSSISWLTPGLKGPFFQPPHSSGNPTARRSPKASTWSPKIGPGMSHHRRFPLPVRHTQSGVNFPLVMTNSLPWKDPPCY